MPAGIQVSEVSTIHCTSVIASLSGLENFTSINTLTLDRMVCDELGRCEVVFPSAPNLFSDLSPLAQLNTLKQLTLFNAQIDDISPLSNLIELQGLDLGLERGTETRARITDISALTGMTKLADLRLGYQAVSDLSVLPNGSVFSYLNLTGNTLATFQVSPWGISVSFILPGTPLKTTGRSRLRSL